MIGISRVAQFRGGRRGLLADVLLGVTAGAQSYTLPSGTQYFDIELYGAGGAGGRGMGRNVGRTVYYVGGGGGGGGGYVRHGFTGAFGSDVINFTIGTGGTSIQNFNTFIGGSGGNTSLTSITRNGNIITAFSEIVAYGGFGGGHQGVTASIQFRPNGGTGGQSLGGNISNRSGLSGNMGGLTALSGSNGGAGGAGGNSDDNVANFIVLNNGGAGGLTSSSTRAVVGGNANLLTVLAGAGGGGGGYAKVLASNEDNYGATGGMGGIRIKVYG